MNGEILGVVGIDGPRVGAHQDRAALREPHRRERREKGASACAKENPPDSDAPGRQRVGADFAPAGKIHHPGWPQEGVERDVADRPSGREHMGRRVDVGAQVRAHGETGGLEEGSFHQTRRGPPAERDVALPGLGLLADGARNVDDSQRILRTVLAFAYRSAMWGSYPLCRGWTGTSRYSASHG